MRVRVVCCVFVVVFAVALAAAFFPGAHSVDTLTQLREGLSGRYRTAHPPLLSWLLATAQRTTGSPGPVLLLQLASFTGAWLWMLWGSRRVVVVVVGALCFVLPPVWGVAITLWKDIWMATALCVCAGALMRGNVVVVVVAAVIACAFRHNAPVVFVPVVVAAAAVVGRVKGIVVVVVACAGMAGVPRAINAAVDAVPIWGLGPTQVWDICHFYGRDRASWRGTPWPTVKRSTWRRHCLDVSAKRIINAQRGLPGFAWTGALTAQRPVVEAEWWRLVQRRPWLWLSIRASAFARFLAVDADDHVYDAFAGPWPTKGLFRGTDTTTSLYAALHAGRTATRTTLLQRPWLWVLALVPLTTMTLRRRRHGALAVCCGLWLHLAALFAVMPATGFRYVHIVVVGDVCVFALLFRDRRGVA